MKKNEAQTDLVQQESKISPVLPNGVKNYLIDIDGTVTEDVPYEGSVDMINTWYDDGHIITFFTSRTDEHEIVTKQWLDKHGFKYHYLLLNKPRGGNYHWIDNHIVRATRYDGKWSELVKKEHTIEVFE